VDSSGKATSWSIIVPDLVPVDNLASNNAFVALSANQGRLLNARLAALEGATSSGGGALYTHNITVRVSTQFAFTLSIINSSQTAFTLATLTTYLVNNGFGRVDQNGFPLYPATGMQSRGFQVAPLVITGLGRSSFDTSGFRAFGFTSDSASQNMTPAITSAITFMDVVVRC
jgi:hypothetical protein